MVRIFLFFAVLLLFSEAFLHRNKIKNKKNKFSLKNLNTANEKYYTEQTLDHFDATNRNVFSQRYFVNDTFFSGNGPVFLCVGGEGPGFEPDVVVTGDVHCALMIQLAQEHSALILALEHRYYGKSIPTKSLSTEDLRFLSSRQALEDISQFRGYIVDSFGLSDKNRWITFGGSYPGMMAGWARLKYPNIIFASVSSSAPVQAQVDFRGYNTVISQSLLAPIVGGSSSCLLQVTNAFDSLGQLLKDSSNFPALVQKFNICNPNAFENEANIPVFAGAISGMFDVQDNDPSCTSEYCNIEKWCSAMLNVSDPLQVLIEMNSALNLGGQCLTIDFAVENEMLTNTTIEGGTDRVWTYQTCAEFGFFQTCNSPTKDQICPFIYDPPVQNLDSFVSQCILAFNITLDDVVSNVIATNNYYGGNNPMGSRIMFVNGDIDPWHYLSVLDSLPEEPALIVHGASHHAWTHPIKNTDSDNLKDARNKISQQVANWLMEK